MVSPVCLRVAKGVLAILTRTSTMSNRRGLLRGETLVPSKVRPQEWVALVVEARGGLVEPGVPLRLGSNILQFAHHSSTHSRSVVHTQHIHTCPRQPNHTHSAQPLQHRAESSTPWKKTQGTQNKTNTPPQRRQRCTAGLPRSTSADSKETQHRQPCTLLRRSTCGRAVMTLTHNISR